MPTPKDTLLEMELAKALPTAMTEEAAPMVARAELEEPAVALLLVEQHMALPRNLPILAQVAATDTTAQRA
jgi:hypothetical protein